MTQGAIVDPSEFIPPWTFLMLNFFSENMDKVASEGSFQPVNIGTGWNLNEDQSNQSTSEEEKDQCPSCKIQGQKSSKIGSQKDI